MKVLLWLILGLTAIFAILNWPTFAQPTDLWLGFTMMRAPLGQILLGVIVLVALISMIDMGTARTAALMETHRLQKELDEQRALANKAEVSRVAELRTYVVEELGRAEQRLADIRSTMISRIEAAERQTTGAVERLGAALSAHLGEISARVGERDAGAYSRAFEEARARGAVREPAPTPAPSASVPPRSTERTAR